MMTAKAKMDFLLMISRVSNAQAYSGRLKTALWQHNFCDPVDAQGFIKMGHISGVELTRSLVSISKQN